MPARSCRANCSTHCPPGARIVDTAPLSLDEIDAEFAARPCRRARRGAAAFRRSVDLQRARRAAAPARAARHSLYADARRAGLRRRGGGAWQCELTVPEVAQSVVLTRVSGRASRMPEAEKLATFAASGATLVIHLAIHAIDAIVAGADAVLRRRLPGGRRGAGELAGASASCAARSPTSPRRSPRRGSSARRSFSSAARSPREDFRDSALYDADYRRRFRGGAA